MTAFVLTAAAMVAVALAWILVPLLRWRRATTIDRAASNAALLRDELAALDADLSSGQIAADRYEQARRELEARVLEEAKSAPPAVPAAPGRASAWTAAIIGAALPLAAVVLYLLLGAPEAFAPQTPPAAAKAGGGDQLTPAQFQEMVERLQARLEHEPTNVEGWALLARAYYVLKRFPEAANAYERVVALAPDVPDLLADYADALATAPGGTLEGKALELVNRALALDPTHWKALALAGTAAFNRRDYPQAIGYWERVKRTVAPDSDIARSIDASIAEARQRGGLPAKPAAAIGATPDPTVR